MKKISLLLMLLISVMRLSAQRFPAEGIGYQAMLSKPDRITYGTKLKNIPISNTDIKVRFELVQSGVTLLTDEHNLRTNVNGIFSCIIGTGKTNPAGLRMSQLAWGRDSVMVKVFVDPGDGEFLFSEQKLWSTAYAMHAATSDIAILDNDTSAQNELQFLILSGDSVKLTQVPGGISLKPWSDGIAKNAADILTEKNRAENSEQLLKQSIDAVDAKYAEKGDELKDSIGVIRGVIDDNRGNINKNAGDIVSINGEYKKQADTLFVLRSEINTNTGDIVNIKSVNKRQDDSLVALRTDIYKNKVDIASIKSVNKRQDDSLTSHRADINKNAADILKHLAADKDTSITNELTDLSFDKTTKVLTLSNPKSTNNQADLSELQDNLGDHTATKNIKLNGSFLTYDGDDEGIYVDDKGRVSLNTKSNDTSLSVDLTKAGRPSSFPVLTETQRNKITNSTDGAVIFNSTSKKVEIFVKGNAESLQNTTGGYAYDGPIHGQTFQTAGGGTLTEVNVKIAPRSSTPLAVTCKLYEGTPGSSASYICDADSAITCYNPTNATFATAKSAVYTFNSAKPKLVAGKTYYLEFSNATSSQFWFEVSNHNGCYVSDQITSGEYYSGNSMNTVAARSSGCNVRDLKGYIKIESPSTWEVLNEDEFTEVDGSTTNELQDLVYNSTTKKLSLSPAKTAGNEIDLSAIGGGDNMGNATTTTVIKAGTVTYPNSHNSTNGQVLTINSTGTAAWQSISGDNMGNATTSNQLTLNDVGANYSFNSSNSSRGVIRMHQKNGVGSIMEFIAQGTASGNFPADMEFYTQRDGYTAPAKNMTLDRNGMLTLHNGSLKVGTVTYPKAHNSTANQVLTVDASGNATWKSPSAPSSLKLDDLTDVIYGGSTPYGSGNSASLFMGTVPSATTGSFDYNVAIGSGSYPKIISGARFNTLVGNRVALNLTSGSQNTFLGNYAGSITTTGQGNVFVGMGTGAGWLSGGDNYNINIGGGSGRMPSGSNNVVIGTDQGYAYIYQGYSNPGSNQVLLGNSLTSSFKCKVSQSTFSDSRIKKNVQEDVHGLDFILKLRPVTYNYKIHKDGNGLGPDQETQPLPNYEGWDEVTKIKFSGFIAQEVEQAAKESGYDFSGVDKPKDEESLYALRYSEFVVPLVKATQEQQKIIENQQKQIEALLKRVEALEKK